MRVLIRADSSSFIGTGHIMRDLVLAKQFANADIIFATQVLEGNINFKIDEAGYKIEFLKNDSFIELNSLVKRHAIDIIIIDNYQINYSFEKKLKEQNSGLKIFVLDDSYEKHHCDILLNHNISADISRYKNLVPEHCELRCGSSYTLLREEFYTEKNKSKKDNVKSTAFIAMGGADHSNKNIEILDIIENIGDINVNVLTTVQIKI